MHRWRRCLTLVSLLGVLCGLSSACFKETLDVNGVAEQALALVREGKREEGVDLLVRRAEAYPSDALTLFAVAFHLEGIAMDARGDIRDHVLQRKALDYMRRAVEMEPGNDRYRLFYARMLVDAEGDDDRDDEKAIEQFKIVFERVDRKLARENEALRDALGIYAELSVLKKRRDEAEKELERWLQPSDWHEQIYGKYVYLVLLRNAKEGERLGQEYLQERGFSPYVKTAICNSKYERRRYREARTCYQELRQHKASGGDFKNYASSMMRKIDSGR